MKRWDLINSLIKEQGYKSYLEIGVRNGETFNKIQCGYKLGVDPLPSIGVDYKMTSNEFFKINKETFDLIFIDGLHKYEQVKSDIINSLAILNTGSVIVCHDMNPPERINQQIPQQTKYWNGDCWKAWADLRRDREDLKMYVIDTDWGLGVIQKGNQKTINYPKNISWDFDKHLKVDRKNILNLISDAG